MLTRRVRNQSGDRRSRSPEKSQFFQFRLGIPLLSCLGAVLTAHSTLAQISSDGTLGTLVTGSPNFTILGGTTEGINLFHSFSEFSLQTGGSATFVNAVSVQNIIGRVTGGNISNIDGNIATANPANLFLINPAGIVFGANATLFGFNGSFFASTADSILFADGVEFNAGRPTSNPLLTVSAPAGLVFKGSRGQIRIEGSGHDRTVASPVFFPLVSPSIAPQGLQLFSSGTLALVGNQVNLEGGVVGAPDGRVEVASVEEGSIGLSQGNGVWTLTYPDRLNFADIQLRSRSLIDASGLGGGSLQVTGRQIAVESGSLVLLQNFGSQPSGTLTLLASESIEVTGISANGQFRSTITTQAVGSGRGADLQIQTPQLLLRQGGRVNAQTFSGASGGDLAIAAANLIELKGSAPQNLQLVSALTTNAYGTGLAGDIRLDTARLRVINGATLSSTKTGMSGGNTLQVNASESIEVIGGIASFSLPSSITAATLGEADAGNVILNTRNLRVLDGGLVDSSTLSGGRAGNVEINASDSVEVRGRLSESSISTISSNGTILDEAFLQTFGFSLFLTGDSGNVTVKTDRLQVSDGGELAVSNEGTGNAGMLQVQANRIELKDGGRLTAATASGEGGNIDLQVSEILLMRRGGLISAEAGGTGNGGNITINAPFIVAVPGENSDIVANAIRGSGGNIDITAIAIFGLEFRDRLTEFSDITASSEFGVSGTVTISNPNVNGTALNAELQGDVLDPDQQVARGCDAVGNSRFIATGRGGIPDNPIERRSGTNAWSDVRDLSAFRDRTSVTRHQLLENGDSLVEAIGWRAKTDGTVEIYAVTHARADALATTDCGALPVSLSHF